MGEELKDDLAHGLSIEGDPERLDVDRFKEPFVRDGDFVFFDVFLVRFGHCRQSRRRARSAVCP